MNLNWLLRTGIISSALILAGCGGGGGEGGSRPADDGTYLPGHDVKPDPEPDPGTEPGTDPAPGACGGVISNCLDLDSAAVTKYKDNKFAAASYTFDDGVGSAFDIADIFEDRGLRATFYIIPSAVQEGEWARWKKLLNKGHEIGNHSMTHNVDMGPPDDMGEWSGEGQTTWATPAQLESEINDSYRQLVAHLGQRLMTFAFPWHSWTEQAWTMALENHFDVRSREGGREEYVFSFFDEDHERDEKGEPDPEKALQRARHELRRAVENGHWFVAAGHGIHDPSLDSDGEGWSPISKQFLETHLDDAADYASRLWVDTYLNVSRYLHCSGKLEPVVSSSASDRISLSLKGNLSKKDKAACTEPLTVSLRLAGQDVQGLGSQDEQGTALPLRQEKGLVLVDVKPGQTVSLQVPR